MRKRILTNIRKFFLKKELNGKPGNKKNLNQIKKYS
jgi:hypothetical protein